MKIKYNLFFLSGIILMAFLTACSEDFLERDPEDRLTAPSFYKDFAQIARGTAPLYNVVWFDFNDKASFAIGDARGGTLYSGSSWTTHVTLTTEATEPEVLYTWQAFFNVIGQSNSVIRNIREYADPELAEDVVLQGIAEARFMRATAYFYLVRLYGAVPIIADNTQHLTDTTLARHTEESVYEFIVRDYRFASKYLPETPYAPGRVTKYSAEAMLAEVFLARSGLNSSGTRNQTDLDSAAYYAQDVIVNGPYALLEDYSDLFLTENNNNPETIFALQWVHNGGWGTQNTMQAYMAFNSSVTGFSDGWGSDHGATAAYLKTVSQQDQRRKATYMFPGDHYDYIHQIVDDPNNPGQTMTVELTKNPNDTVRANVKKYVVGLPIDNEGRVAFMATAINTYIMRLAEVYLIYAEAKLGNQATLGGGDALMYFNMVRERAGLDPLTSITMEDILHERLVETAMEGQFWYDLVRIHYYDPAWAKEIIRNQDRGSYIVKPVEGSDPMRWEISENQPVYIEATDSDFRLPLPEVELTRAPNLRKDPVEYAFESEE